MNKYRGGESRYNLTRDDMYYAMRIAELRNEYEDIHGHGVQNPNIQDEEDKSFHTHLVGAVSEVGVARYYGSQPNLTYETDGKGGRKPDLWLFGYTCEVKATEREGPSRLIVPKGRLREADVYFLVYVSVAGEKNVKDVGDAYIEIRGWAFWQDVLNNAEHSFSLPPSLRHKPIWAVREDNLRRVTW